MVCGDSTTKLGVKMDVDKLRNTIMKIKKRGNDLPIFLV